MTSFPWFGVDYYGVPRVRQMLLEEADCESQLVTCLFTDALLEAGAHCYGSACGLLERPQRSFVINSNNIMTSPEANISHRYPQVFLGLHRRWSEAEVADFEPLLLGLVQRLAPWPVSQMRRLARHLASDTDLEPTSFDSVGCEVPDQLRVATRSVLSTLAHLPLSY